MIYSESADQNIVYDNMYSLCESRAEGMWFYVYSGAYYGLLIAGCLAQVIYWRKYPQSWARFRNKKDEVVCLGLFEKSGVLGFPARAPSLTLAETTRLFCVSCRPTTGDFWELIEHTFRPSCFSETENYQFRAKEVIQTRRYVVLYYLASH